MRVSRFRSLRLLTLATSLIGACGCDQVKMFRNRDLAFSYQDDSEGLVDRASVDSNTRVIASAKRVAIRTTSDPAVTETEVAETHFVRGTLEVVYTGNLVFQCRSGQEWCQRIREVRASGARPRDVFRKWPVRLSGPLHGYPL
jgi:hypothetical protein